jgi:hypothetical protein
VRSPSAYRHPEVPAAPPSREDVAPTEDHDLIPVFTLLWLVSILEVRGAIDRGRFGGIDTLAALAVIVLPLMIRTPLVAVLRRAARGLEKS